MNSCTSLKFEIYTVKIISNKYEKKKNKTKPFKLKYI